MSTAVERPRRAVLRGGAVRTDAHPGATAMCTEGDRIVRVGSDAEVAGYVNGADEVIELAGDLVTPAFVDAHVHLSHTGLRLSGLDLSTATDKLAVLSLVEQRARTTSAPVILGYAWDEELWRAPALPTAAELDRAAPGRAVYLSRVDGHSALVSGRLVDAVPDVRSAAGWSGSGRVERDAHHLVRAAADAMITPAERESALRTALAAAAATGVGCVHEMSAPHLNPPDDLTILRRITGAEATPTVIGYWGAHADDGGIEHARALGCAGAAGDLCADGALGSRTAALTRPYADAPGHHGHAYLDAEQVSRHVVACTEAGLQAGFHCIGDAAVSTVLAGFRAATVTVGPDRMRQARHRLEHAELFAPELHREAASYGIVVSAQPAFDAAWGGSAAMYATRLGVRRAETANPLAQLHAAGVRLAFGSDSPVTPIDPWAGVRAAVHHRTERHRLDPAAAFAAHTAGGWYAAGVDDAGVLRAGAAATYAIWTPSGGREPGDAATGEPGDSSCRRTVVSGRVVFSRPGDDHDPAAPEMP